MERMDTENHVFVGRQPILNRKQRIVAYELLFRGSMDAQNAQFREQSAAAIRVIVNTFASMGVEAVLGGSRGFFNVTGPLLRAHVVDALPSDRVVIEVLENVDADQQITDHCAELKKKGFRLALDDYVPGDPRDPLLDLVDVVKVDLPRLNDQELRGLVRRLRRHDVLILAEKVETREQFEHCLDCDFDLFQGYFFARPIVLKGTAIDPARAALIELLQMLRLDADLGDLAEVFKRNLKLGVNLLRLVNSAALARPHKTTNIDDALAFIGRQQLARWITILIFAGDDEAQIESPLLRMAVHRGRLMELICGGLQGASGSGSQQESAFLVGMLSLVDVLLSRPAEEIVEEFNLEDELAEALLKREGCYGVLLSLVEEVESVDIGAVSRRCADLGITVSELQEFENSAYSWVHGLMRDCEG